MEYNSMLNTVSEYCREYASSYGSTGYLILNLILILTIAVIAVVLFNRYNLVRSGSTERLTRVEKDIDDVKRIVGDIKNKLDDI